jgi:hypothetical protein
MYGKIPLPGWLQLGGELRGAAGYVQAPQKYLAGFPMAVDLYGRAHWKGFSVVAEIGPRPATEGVVSQPAPVWSREHYVMWQQHPDANEGLYVRVGRFMPVFGLRLAEHEVYTRRFGGTPLYSETYGAAIAYVTPKWEAHLTGFVEDPILDAVRHDDGAAAYGEIRLNEKAAVGVEGMIQIKPDDKKFRGGVTGKYYLEGPDLLLSGEIQAVTERIEGGGAPAQLVAYLMGSWFLPHGLLLDVGYGHFDENIRIKNLDRDCLDVNLHWFVSSHFEAVLNARGELIGQGNGGPTGSYVLIQGHYRL